MKAHTILIVDDQSVNRKILRRLLETDYEILEAENGRIALEILHNNAGLVSAVLLDIVMPVMNGYEVLECMSRDSQLSKIPVIVSSQKDGDEAEVRALTLGAQDFIAKPYKIDIIRHRLENTIRLRETASIVNRAEKDELTGLLNKTFFTERVGSILRQNIEAEYDIVCYDIEKFKLVNDAYGENTGDKLLCYVGSLLKEAAPLSPTARFSADHFYQLLPREQSITEASVADFIAKLQQFPIEMRLNVNCGVYKISDFHASVSSMCDRAKLAADSNHGRADVRFALYDESMRQKLLDEQFIVGSMERGVEQHEFQVYYQPKYDLHTEMVAGAEALVRWNHPEKGFMSPGMFIPVFERNGFITRLDRYVWEEACKDIRSWMDADLPPVPVSVNVSRADIFNPKLTEILLDLVKKYEIPIAYLHLEVTESAYTDNPQQIISVVAKLHDMGFTIEMDDFGSGYSSLNMLAELPVDILKLDMGFVQAETMHSSGRGIMSFVISMAKWMKLAVIAEGVETAEQIETLRSMDCNFVQGYYFAKPMPKVDFEKTLRTVAVAALEAAENTVPVTAKGDTEPTADDKPILLIVDDIEVNRAVLTSIFRDEYTVVEKENGHAAINYLRDHGEEVSVILLDLLMPVMDGFQVLKELGADEKLRGIPVVVTSQGDATAEEKALEMGAEDFVSKPYRPQVVRHRVQNVVRMYHKQEIQRQKLSDTRKREQTLMSSIPGGVAIYRMKKNGKVATEYVSDGLAKLCGYTTEDFLDHIREDARINVLASDVPALALAAKQSIEDHTPLHMLQHIYTKNGDLIAVRLDANIMSADLAEDEVAVLYAVHTRMADNTDTVLQEQNRYRYILDNLDVAYFEYSTNGQFYASDKYSLYVLSEDEPEAALRDGGSYAGIHPDDLPILFDFIQQKNRHLPKVTATLRLKMKDGTYRWTEMSGFYDFDANGERTKSIGVLRDVDNEWQNRNRKLEEALSIAEKANRSKMEFLERVSHEMRTPLNGILGLAELMGSKQAGADIRGDITELKQSGHYLLDLINDTLDVGTIEQGKLHLSPTVCDGRTAFNNVVNLVRPSMQDKNIKFALRADNLPFTMLYIDVGRVQQAIINVLNNAVKFTPEGGRVEFIMENLSNRDGIITDRIIIRDTGIGIGPEFLPHVFEPFAQEHNDKRTMFAGTGLGMTIAKQCVDLMGGAISVTSKPGEGTEVTIVLPMPIATAKQLNDWHDEQACADLNMQRGKRILLCEDHPLNAQIAIRLLQSKGLVVDHAENGAIGVEKFANSTIDYYAAILMDIRMPVMDGLEATRIIRKMQRKDARCIPIIAMTANAMQEDVKNALNAGMTEHLGKPVEPAKLYSTLAKLITRPNPFVGEKVLVVDDIDINRAMVRKAIQDIYTIFEAANGAEALDVLKKNKDIVAVVTDIQMPVMDGKALIRNIRADRDFDKVAILANTIYGDHRQEDELLALGANDFVYKPTSPQVVKMRLEHILRNME